MRRQVAVTHPEKVLWPDDGITKGDLVAYYRAIAPVMLPHLKNRPITTRQYHDGIAGPGIYRREAPKTGPEWLRHVTYTTVTDRHEVNLPLIDDELGLRWFVNGGAIEFHAWSSRAPKLEVPDRVVLDLDPGDEAGFPLVLEAARIVHDTLTALGIDGLPKTSGGRGLHIWWALAPGYDFVTVRDWVDRLSERLAAGHPRLFATAHGETHRGDRITIDAAQNSIGRNTAAPYTVRGRPGAPVSTPLSWDEIRGDAVDPAHFTVKTVPERVARLGDLFAPLRRRGGRLPELS